MQQLAEKVTSAVIAEEIAQIAGFHVTPANRHNPGYQALEELVGYVIDSHNPMLNDPRILNAHICRTNGKFEWRNGTPAEFKGIPKAEYCKLLYRLWWTRVLRLAEVYAESTDDAEKELFCRNCYAMLLCIRPFANKNGTTALVFLYNLRRCVGLPVTLVRYKREIVELNAFVRRFRKEVVISRFGGKRFMID